MITEFNIFENSDYFQNGDIILKPLDNTLHIVYDIKNKLYLRIGIYHFKGIKWFVNDIEKLNQSSVYKLYEEQETLVYMTIPDKIINEIKNISNIDISKKVKDFRIDNLKNKYKI